MIEEWSIEREFRRETYEHEVLLSFENDSGAYYFNDWWQTEGSKLFDTYVLNSEVEY